MTQKYIKIYLKNDSNSTGFEGRIIIGSRNTKTKFSSFNKKFQLSDSNQEENSFKIVEEWCIRQSLETGIEYIERTMEDVLNCVRGSKNRVKSRDKISGNNPLVELFGHPGKFKAVVKQAYKQSGYERTKALLTDAIKILEELSEIDRAELAAKQKLNEDVAKVFFNLYLSTGMDMSEQCVNDVVRSIYRLKVKEHNA